MALSLAVTAAIIFVLSLFFLAASALFLARSLLQIAKVIGISSFVIGVTVLSIATATPEFLNVLISGLRGVGEIGIGDVVGASIFDLCLTLGIVSLIAKPQKLTAVENHVFTYSLFTVGVFAFLAFDGALTRLDGGVMFALFIFYQYLTYKKGIKFPHKHIPFKKIETAYIIAPLSVFSLIVSSWLLVTSGASLATSVGIPASIIGLILVALGTSAPEFASGVAAALKKGEGLAFGTTLGAIVLHFFFATGLAALINPFTFDFVPFRIPLIILFATIATFTAYVNIRKQSDKYLGLILIAIYILFLALNLSGIVETEVHVP